MAVTIRGTEDGVGRRGNEPAAHDRDAAPLVVAVRGGDVQRDETFRSEPRRLRREVDRVGEVVSTADVVAVG